MHGVMLLTRIGLFSSCFEPHYENEIPYNVIKMKISFHSYANKTNFHVKTFALRDCVIIEKYETGSLLSSLCSVNLARIGFGIAFFSLPRF